jgi:hypothetical protein
VVSGQVVEARAVEAFFCETSAARRWVGLGAAALVTERPANLPARGIRGLGRDGSGVSLPTKKQFSSGTRFRVGGPHGPTQKASCSVASAAGQGAISRGPAKPGLSRPCVIRGGELGRGRGILSVVSRAGGRRVVERRWSSVGSRLRGREPLRKATDRNDVGGRRRVVVCAGGRALVVPRGWLAAKRGREPLEATDRAGCGEACGELSGSSVFVFQGREKNKNPCRRPRDRLSVFGRTVSECRNRTAEPAGSLEAES